MIRARPRRLKAAFRPARARYRTRAAASRLGPAVLLVAAAAGLSWGALRARDAWARAAFFRVSAVAVEPFSLQDGAPPEGFARAVGLSPGDPLFGFSARALTARLERDFPELGEVRVRRGWGGGVRVLFARRRAAAKVWLDGQWMGMDAEGGVFPLRVFAPEEAPPENLLPEERVRPLPILAGASAGAQGRQAAALLAVLARLPQPWARGFYKMKVSPSGEATLFLKDGPSVLWGDLSADERRAAAKSDRLERVLRHPRLGGAAPASVRFVDDRRVAVTPKET